MFCLATECRWRNLLESSQTPAQRPVRGGQEVRDEGGEGVLMYWTGASTTWQPVGSESPRKLGKASDDSFTQATTHGFFFIPSLRLVTRVDFRKGSENQECNDLLMQRRKTFPHRG